MTLEEFKEIKKKILDDIKARKRKCQDPTWGVYYSIEISGVMELARAVEEKFKKSKEIVGTTTIDKSLEKFLVDNSLDIQKKLKALEIIKKWLSPILFEHDFGRYYIKFQKGNTMVFYEIETKDEYEAVKEWLEEKE